MRPVLAPRLALLLGLALLAAAGSRGAARASGPASKTAPDLIEEGRYDEALAAARARLAAVEAAAGPDSPEAARAIAVVLRAGYWSSQPNDPELLALARRAVAIDEQSSGPEGAPTAESLQGLAAILVARGASEEARAPCERALAICEKAFGRDSLEAAGAAGWLGVIEENTGNLRPAAAQYERALAIQEKALGPEDRGVAQTLNSLASVYRQLGDYPKAIASRQRCLAIREKAYGPDHPQVAWALHNLANLYNDLGEFARARELYARALAIREKILPADHPDLGYSHNSLGIVAYGLADYTTARDEYAKALLIREKAHGAEHALVAATLNNLGNLLDDMGETEEARAALERALAIKTKRLGPDHWNTALTEANLGNVLRELREFGPAEEHVRHALAAREAALGAEHPDVGASLDDLGWVRHERGDDAGAVPLLARALLIREKALGGGHYDVAATLARLAVAQAGAGDATGALPLARRAVAIQRAVLGADHPTVAGTLLVLGSIQLDLGDAAAALATALESESIGREHFRRTARHLSEREALVFESVRSSGLDVALAALPRAPSGQGEERAEAVLDSVIRSRALVLDSLATRRRQAAEARSEEASRRLAKLRVTAATVARLARREPDPDHPERSAAQLRGAQEAKERAERDLIAISPAERRWSEEGGIGLAEVRSALPDGTALVSYVRFTPPGPAGAPPSGTAPAPGGGDAYTAFVTAGSSARPNTRAVPLGPASAIDPLVQAWREAAARGAQAPSVSLAARERDYRAAAGALRRAVWDPVAPLLEGTRTAFIVPDGEIDLVSFATLPAGEDRYLIETAPLLQYLSAERDLIAAARPRAAGEGLLVVGGVDYGAAAGARGARGPESAERRPGAAPCSPFASLQFPPLPGTEREADRIVRAWTQGEGTAEGSRGGVTRLAGRQARAAAFLAGAPGKRVLHLATHGFFLGDACAERPGPASSDPMLLSGLAFAGANETRGPMPAADDGLLTAEEIAALDLSGVEWAVLSACDTGIGTIRHGEGVLGLRRAFAIAGAATLIMSLWPVRDADAAEWMAALYAARFARLDTVQAMRRAAIGMIQARRRAGRSTHPGAWGSFVACGDGR